MNRSARLAVALAALLAAGTTMRAEQPVEIRLAGHFYSEPATVRIVVAVEPDEHNRVLRVEADGEAMFRASELPLAAGDTRRLYTIEFRSLAAGNYTVRAEVRSAASRLAEVEQQLTVLQ